MIDNQISSQQHQKLQIWKYNSKSLSSSRLPWKSNRFLLGSQTISPKIPDIGLSRDVRLWPWPGLEGLKLATLALALTLKALALVVLA